MGLEGLVFELVNCAKRFGVWECRRIFRIYWRDDSEFLEIGGAQATGCGFSERRVCGAAGGPVAKKLKIPYVVHESDAVPGL